MGYNGDNDNGTIVVTFVVSPVATVTLHWHITVHHAITTTTFAVTTVGQPHAYHNIHRLLPLTRHARHRSYAYTGRHATTNHCLFPTPGRRAGERIIFTYNRNGR